ncbi:hypothetical protein LIER_08504 [Lithospermum erythrorhizon]|uniref:F-box domain-containing protein n=1 Tax=Lithospermum erythrorhizon TaxID=34254 RepID=A0AAV3PGJ0_LITER
MHQEDGRRKRICRDINSGAIVSDCQDLLASILLHLPARTLVRLKLVSKQFHSVISDRLFGIDHFRFHHRDDRNFVAPTGLYFYSSFSNCPEIYSVSISNPEKSIPSLSSLEFVAFLLDRQFKIVQSCNGLLLCSFHNENSYDSSSPSGRLYCVCNPTTQDFTMLPELPTVESSSKAKNSKSRKEEELCDPVLTLAFNPFQTHIYKVFGVRVVKQLARKCTCELLVYSSDEGGRVWRKVGCQFSIPVVLKKIHHGVFHDGGKITWICERGFIHFDVQTEKVMEVTKRPTRQSTWKKIRFFGESIDGRLQLIKLRHYSGVNVNELRPGTSKWKFRFRIHPQSSILDRHLDVVQESYLDSWKQGFCSDMYQILAVLDGGKELILAIPGMVLRYCRVSKNSWVLRELPQQFQEDISFGCVTSFHFVETLSPV